MPRRTRSTGRAGGQRPAKVLTRRPFATLVAATKLTVDGRLSEILAAERRRAKLGGRDVAAMVDALAELCLRGGKRLRAALVVTGFQAASEREQPGPAIEAGVALELLQSYFLVHDDWMDGDDLRRGGPSVHAALTRRFGSERLGAMSGILAGDYLVGLAARTLGRAGIPAERLPATLECFGDMQLDAVAGQQLDVVARDADPELVNELKTGSYTVRGPLRLGALIAGARKSTIDALDRFAMPAGVAFQLADDLSSAFDESSVTGKPFGGDLRAGKRTVLLALARSRARGADRRLLLAAAGNPRASERQLRAAAAAMERCGARQLVEARVEQLQQQARSALTGARLTRSGRELLADAASVLAERRGG